MAAPSSAPRGPQDSTITQVKSPVAAHPITSAAIALLITASICGTLIVPIYARITPKIGDWPFFYFYLIAYIPVAAVILWIVNLLQRRLRQPADGVDGAVR
jgi:fucose permease